ncbi:MAG: nitroreductase family protein [Brotaphodocola sp.]
MNTIMENILTRRSTRAFEEKEIPADELKQILQAAIYAPSGMNRQTWQFTAVCTRAKIQELASIIGKELGRDGYDMYDPQVIILASNEKDSPWSKDDNACAMENIFLAAHSFGIGSVWINQLRDICDRPSVRKLLTSWGVPENHTVTGIAALGYAAPAPKKDIQKTGKIVILE